MSHVQITQAKPHTPLSIKLDGMEIGKVVLTDGFKVTYDHENYEARIHMILAPDTLEVDLTDAVLEVIEDSREMDPMAARASNSYGGA